MAFENILITGGAGFIGSHLARKLLNRAARVTVYDNLSVGRKENVPSGANLIIGDLMDYARVASAVAEADAVCHLAARVSIRASMDGFHEDAQTNLLGTLNVVRALSGSRVRKLVFASSMAVYADSESAQPIPENYPTEPASFYGISKLAGEKYVSLAGQSLGVHTAILRYFNTYGPGQAFTPYVGVITIFINRLLAGEAPVIFGDGQQHRDFIAVQDVVQGTIAALEWEGTSGVFNLGTGQATSVNQIAELLIRRLAPQVRPKHAPKHPGELKNSIADIRQARELLGFEPTVRLPEVLDEIIEWNRRIGPLHAG